MKASQANQIGRETIPVGVFLSAQRARKPNSRPVTDTSIYPVEGNLALKLQPQPELRLPTPKLPTSAPPSIQYNITYNITAPRENPPLIAAYGSTAEERTSEPSAQQQEGSTEESSESRGTKSGDPTNPETKTTPIETIKEESAPPKDNSLWWCGGGFLASIAGAVIIHLSQLNDYAKQSGWILCTALGVLCGFTGLGKAVIPSSSTTSSTVNDSYTPI